MRPSSAPGRSIARGYCAASTVRRSKSPSVINSGKAAWPSARWRCFGSALSVVFEGMVWHVVHACRFGEPRWTTASEMRGCRSARGTYHDSRRLVFYRPRSGQTAWAAAIVSASILEGSEVCNRKVGPRPGWRTSVDHCNLSAGEAVPASIKIVSFGNAAAAYGKPAGASAAIALAGGERNVSQVVHALGQWCSAVANVGGPTRRAANFRMSVSPRRDRKSAEADTMAVRSLAIFRCMSRRSIGQPITGCNILGAISAAGSNTNRRNDIRGWGSVSICVSATSLS